MYNKNYETIDQYLNRQFSNKKTERPSKNINISKNGTKKIIIAVIASILALITTVSGFLIFGKKKNQNTTATTTSTNSQSNVITLDDIGAELEFSSSSNKKFGSVVSGNIDLNKIVEKNKLYVDKENADKSNKVGNSSIDTKGNTLKVEDGKVKDKTTGYEIKDGKTNSTIQTGDVNSNGTIPGFEYNENLGGTYEEKDNTSNLVKADSDYYNENGELLIKKGALLTKEALEHAKKNLSTKPIKKQTTTSNTQTSNSSITTSNTQTSNSSTTTSNTTSKADNGIVNKDGTYTIDGITYLSKEDYNQCIIDGYQGYAIIDGIMQPMQNEKQFQKVK